MILHILQLQVNAKTLTMYATPRLPSATKISHSLGTFLIIHKDVLQPQFKFVFVLRETFLLCLQENKIVGKTDVVLEGFQAQASNKRIFGLGGVPQTFVGMA